MKKLVTLAALTLSLAVGAACASTAKPIPQSGAIAQTPSTISVPAETLANAKKDTGNIVHEATTTTTEAPAKASSCDVAREALLTGTPAQINSAMAGLVADRTADGTAREYADYYLHRDAPPAYGSKDLRSMDITLVRTACS